MVIKALDPDWIRIRIGLQPQTLDPDPDPDQKNTDPKPWFLLIQIRDVTPITYGAGSGTLDSLLFRRGYFGKK